MWSPPDPRRLTAQLTGAAALGAAARWVRAGWLPRARPRVAGPAAADPRHRFDGHEADYLRAFQGEALEASTRLYPTLAWGYAALGRLSDDPRLLIALSLCAGLAAVGAGGWTIGRRFGAAAGWWTAALMAASGPLAFWSSSAYNVILPQALLLAGCAAGGWPGALLYGAACAGRVELALLAPAVGLVAGWRVAPGALAAGLMWPLMDTAPAVYSPLEVLPANLLLPDLLGPLGAPVGLLLVAAAARRAAWPLFAAAAWTHLVGACFDDYGYRHGLFGGFALAGALAVGGQGARWRQALPVVGLALSLWGCAEVASWYYARDDLYAASLPALGPPPPCDAEIMDDPLHPDSHWSARGDWPAGAVCWGEEFHHRAWTSRALHPRRLRMRRLYDLEPAGVLRLPGGPRLVYSVRR